MANFRKSFNFRNGVQVDEDNFIVNSNGLVGIGTSVPSEILDVRGTLKVVGIATVNNLYVGVATVTDLKVGVTSFRSGIITATSTSGIVTYYGDGRYLQGLPTSQWVDTDVGLGYTSIYAAGNVGVGTVDPRFSLQIGGNTSTTVTGFTSGVGISSVGNVLISGIATASRFYGYGIGITGLNASDAIDSGTLNNSRLPSNINISGIITASVFNGSVIGIASTARDLTSNANIKIVAVNAGYSTAGVSTVHNTLHIDGGKITVGNLNPQSDLYIRNSGISSIQVVSDSNESRLLLGRSIAGAGSNYASLKFGNADGTYTSSNTKTFDIFNFDTGSINQYLHAGTSGINTGRWGWIYGQSLVERMSLTWDGNLGLGITNPSNTLHVVGTSTVTSNSFVGGTLNANGSLTVGGATVNGNAVFLNGSVGIATNSPTHTLQVGRSPVSSNGVGISSVGNVIASGIVTASRFISGSGFNVSAAGTITAPGGFTVNGSNPVEFSLTGSVLTISIQGVGSTNLTLY